MHTLCHASSFTALAVLSLSLLSSSAVRAQPAPAKTAATTLSFNGSDYLHRWSQAGQHEFTPRGEEDLKAWTSMITINVHDWAKTGNQLAELANRVLGNYEAAGKIIRTDSTPRTKDHEAEHLAVVILGDPKFLEATFARFVLRDGCGYVIVYGKRVYGTKAGDDMSAWLKQHGPDTERALMAWNGLPSTSSLNALTRPSR